MKLISIGKNGLFAKSEGSVIQFYAKNHTRLDPITEYEIGAKIYSMVETREKKLVVLCSSCLITLALSGTNWFVESRIEVKTQSSLFFTTLGNNLMVGTKKHLSLFSPEGLVIPHSLKKAIAGCQVGQFLVLVTLMAADIGSLLSVYEAKTLVLTQCYVLFQIVKKVVAFDEWNVVICSGRRLEMLALCDRTQENCARQPLIARPRLLLATEQKIFHVLVHARAVYAVSANRVYRIPCNASYRSTSYRVVLSSSRSIYALAISPRDGTGVVVFDNGLFGVFGG